MTMTMMETTATQRRRRPGRARPRHVRMLFELDDDGDGCEDSAA